MDNNDLTKIWHDAHIQNQGKMNDSINIEELIKMRHCKTISQVLSDIKLRILLYSMLLSVFAGLMIYAFVVLGINFTVSSIVPFTMVGLFLLISTTMEIGRLLVFTSNADSLPVKQSQIYFRRNLNRVKKIDFYSYLILLYALAIVVIRGYTRDIGGFKNLSGTNEFQPLIFIFIFILLLTPWFLKYQNNQRYKKIYSELNELE